VLSPRRTVAADSKLTTIQSPLSTTGGAITPYQDVTIYNNFYEFGAWKSDPSHSAGYMKTSPWTVTVDRLVKKKKTAGI